MTICCSHCFEQHRRLLSRLVLSMCLVFCLFKFRREFVLLFLGESDILTVMEFLDILRAVSKYVVHYSRSLRQQSNSCVDISSVKSDTKWLSWIAYQFHSVTSKHRSNAHNPTHVDETMNLETFKANFYFKVVCIHMSRQRSDVDCSTNSSRNWPIVFSIILMWIKRVYYHLKHLSND
jgi:hypothetical protein